MTWIASWPRTQACSCSQGRSSAAAARWQIVSTAPVESMIPNRSAASSQIPRRETRLRAVNVTTAARNLGPNIDPAIPAGSSAVVLM